MLDRDENAVLNILAACSKELTEMTARDKTLEKKSELLDQSIINLEELRIEIEAYLSSIPDDPDRLEEINLRLDEIYRLKKKYGGSEEAILATLESIDVQLGRKIDVDDRIRMLETQECELRGKYEKLALQVSSQRRSASGKLATKVIKELSKVGMDSARFEYEFTCEDDPDGIRLAERRVKPGPEGLETGRFLISANPGEPLKPLSKTASGGEISRIMLALKAADRQKSRGYKALLVFDEVDSGIGGKTANMVADRLLHLSEHSQVLVISHLHQIASLGDHHYAVEKIGTRSKRKVISVKLLTGRDKKKEIERMLSLPQDAKVSLDSD
jgi:DNA repair protein RecN (Recombination protein N)